MIDPVAIANPHTAVNTIGLIMAALIAVYFLFPKWR